MKGGFYAPGDPVALFTNTIGPYANPSVTYEYYSLPFCKPDAEHLSKSKQTLGMAMEGDRLFNSLYDHRYAVPITNKILCTKTLSVAEVEQFKKAISKAYFFEFWMDGLPLHGFIGWIGTDTDDYQEVKEQNHYLFSHLHFTFLYNEDRIIYANVTIDTERSHIIKLTDQETTVTFSYSSTWEPTNLRYSARQKLLKPLVKRDLEIHWLSILNSVGLVLLLTGFLAVIINRIIRKDINRYTKSIEEGENDDNDYGWKLVHGDVFRFPEGKLLLCSLLGVGAQLLSVCTSLLALSAVGLLYPEQMGSLYSAGVVLMALTSVIAGAVSGGFYKKIEGQHWAWNIILASGMLVIPVTLITAVGNFIALFYHSTSALPITTGIQIFLIWLFVGFPLTVIGGIGGRRIVGPFDAPIRTKIIPREIPPIPVYRQAPFQLLVGGFLPFSAIYIELHYLYAALWSHSVYGLYGILLLVFMILLIVTASVAVALTYFQLSLEDHRWWWRSFFTAGSTGLFVFAYSVYYYLELSSMNGLLQAVKYFSFVSTTCYLFFVMLGTVGFYSSLIFVRRIYSTLKID